jgi:hypothetical protein
MKMIIIYATLFFGFISTSIAQNNTVSSGGDALGSGGSVSYSVGQVLYSTTNISSNGFVTQGLQQPYDISVVTGIESTLHLEMSVYPNPTTNFLYINLKDQKIENLSYHLFDLQGRELQREKITMEFITLKMETFPPSTYFLKITDGIKPVKTIKIIKN